MNTFNVNEFGAAGDGKTVDTSSLQRAIDTCSAAGGGQVVFSQGIYLSSTLFLKSGVCLHLEEGATLLGTPDKDAYSPPPGVSTRWLRALLVGENVENISFTGKGIIDGNNVFDPEGEAGMRGPHMILLRRCQNVLLQDVNLRHAANYAFLFNACEHVRVIDVTIEGGWDGVHFREMDGAWNRDVSIARCEFYTGDDSIAGSGIENLLIEDCIINSSCNGIRLIGPAEGLTLRNCYFFGPGKFMHRKQKRTNMLAGILLQPSAWNERPGPLDNVRISDVIMENVQAAFSIVVRKGNTGGLVEIERLSATLSQEKQAASSVESWNDEPFENVVCRDIVITADGGEEDAHAHEPIQLPGRGVRRLPVWGLYARNIRSLTLERINLFARIADARPAVRLEGIEKYYEAGLIYSPAAEDVQAMVLQNVGSIEKKENKEPPLPPRVAVRPE